MKIINWTLDPNKYLSNSDAQKLLDAARFRARQAYYDGRKIAIRDYFIIHLGLATGLRVMEIAALNCGDIYLKEKMPFLIVRNGKGGKKRIVYFNTRFRKHCSSFMNWKRKIGESIQPDSPLLVSSNTGGYMSTRGIQKVFKRCAVFAGIAPHYSIHCLRHTYACFLLKASDWNLRLVQKQLGHSRITTTQVYADVMTSDASKALSKMPL